MSGLQLSGLASGLDWKSLVDQLIQVQRTPEIQLQSQKTRGATKLSGLETIKKNLIELQTSIKALNTGNVFSGRAAKVADTSSGWSASAAAGVDPGQYTFNVTQLATKASLAGAADAGAGISATSDVSGVTIATMNLATSITAGEFSVNGAKVTVALTDSLEDVFGKISTATGGAVTAAYDPVGDRVSLNSASPITLGAANDTSNLLTSLKLYNNGSGNVLSPAALGVVSVSAAIENSNLKSAVTNVDGSGNGSFSINGVSIAFNVQNDSVGTVLSRINASSAGVSASYDKSTDKFTLTNKTTGDTGIAVSETSGGLLEALGLNGTGTFSRGANAEFSINGGSAYVSASNVFDESVHGIAGLSVSATSNTTQTVNVSSDTTGARAKIDDFITKYNAIHSYIDAQSKTTTGSDGKVTTSTFSGNSEVTEIARSLRSIAFNAVAGLTGTIQRLEAIGIDFKSGSSQLEVKDSSKLDAAITGHTEEVQNLFNSQPGGLVAQLDAFVTRVTGSDGTIATQSNTINSRSKDIDNQIAAIERRIAADQARLTAGFVAMEKAQALLQQQSKALTNAFGSSSSSSSSS